MFNLRNKIKFIIPLLFVVSSVFGKTSGYMGKRLALSYGLELSPAFFNPTPNQIFGSIDLNIGSTYQLEYILNRKLSVGLSLNRMKTQALFSSTVVTYEFDDIYTNEYSTSTDYIDVNGDINATGFGISLKYYTRNVAPLGGYLKAEFQYLPYKFNRTYSDEETEDNDYIFVDPDGYHTYAVKFEFGKQRVYFDRIIINMAINSGFVFDNTLIRLDSNFNQYESVYYNSNLRLMMMSFFNLKIGIGLLAF